MRDIGAQAGVLGGSLYHHVKSKDALFVELHNGALAAAAERISGVVAAAKPDPWVRLQAACETLLEIQLASDSLTLPMMNDLREVPEDVKAQLIDARDRFENLFRELVDDLPLPAGFDRSVYRNLLLLQLNTTADWYRPGRLTPRQIAGQILNIFRHI